MDQRTEAQVLADFDIAVLNIALARAHDAGLTYNVELINEKRIAFRNAGRAARTAIHAGDDFPGVVIYIRDRALGGFGLSSREVDTIAQVAAEAAFHLLDPDSDSSSTSGSDSEGEEGDSEGGGEGE
jgi:hypothetical protein